MRRQAGLGAAAAALLLAAPAAAQDVPSAPKFDDSQPMNAGAGASQAAQARAGVTATGAPADAAHNALQYPALRRDALVQDPAGARIGVITQVIDRDGRNEAYAVVRTGDRRVRVPASKLRAAGERYVLDDVAWLRTAPPAD